MSMYILVLAIAIGFPLSGFAQFVDRGEFVEVSKGVKQCRLGCFQRDVRAGESFLARHQ
jgi:hypothetical protein